MATKHQKKPADYIFPLNMNGLRGRMLRMPAPANRTREILFIYGSHSSLERWWGAIQVLNTYGAITVPDLPGFGGMDSFYKIGEKPTVDNLADYLAAFIKLRYKRRRVTIIGLSFGFVVVTRMLQRYPDLARKVDILISVAGFSHRDDFTLGAFRYNFFRIASSVCSHRLPAMLFRNICLNPWVLRAAYSRIHGPNQKFTHATPQERKELMDFEVHLWHANDLRTHMATVSEFLKIDNCKAQVALPVWNVSLKADQYFDEHMVEQHMRVIFKSYHHVVAKMHAHAPSVLADAKTVGPLFPPKIRRLLSKA